MTARIPLPSKGARGEDSAKTATATCYCGAIQLSFPTEGKDLIDSFVCNCTDCRKITASMFASNLIIHQNSVRHLRGQDLLTKFVQKETIDTGNTMESHFCSVCGTLMYRISSGSPDNRILRLGTVDDFSLHDGKLKPRIEQFCKDRVSWLTGGVGIRQVHENYDGSRRKREKSVL